MTTFQQHAVVISATVQKLSDINLQKSIAEICAMARNDKPIVSSTDK